MPGLHVVLMAAPGGPSEQALLREYQDLPCLTKPLLFRDKQAETLQRLLGPPKSEPGGSLPSMGSPRMRRRPLGKSPGLAVPTRPRVTLTSPSTRPSSSSPSTTGSGARST